MGEQFDLAHLETWHLQEKNTNCKRKEKMSWWIKANKELKYFLFRMNSSSILRGMETYFHVFIRTYTVLHLPFWICLCIFTANATVCYKTTKFKVIKLQQLVTEYLMFLIRVYI